MIWEAYSRRRSALETELAACDDVKAAADCLGRTLEQIRRETRSEDPGLRHQADRLFDAAKQAALLMMTVTANAPAAEKQKLRNDRLVEAAPWVSAGLGGALTLWMLLIGQSGAAALALVIAAVGVVEARFRPVQSTPDSRTRIDPYELLRLTDRLVRTMDDSLSEAASEQEKLEKSEQPRLTGDLLEPVQMLMEAVYTGDGDYALKAAPQLVTALGAQGIELIPFSEENRRYFDLFPSTEPGLTIRPALLKNGELLARGQATEQV